MEYSDVTLLVAPFGFGSLGKGLAMAEEFIRQGYSVKILCDPVAQKVVKPSGIPVANYEYREELELKNLNTKAVISSGDIGTPIIKGDTPFIVVDSLFWLRGKWERLPSSEADIYIAQRFFLNAPKAAEDAIGERLKYVDAILPHWATSGQVVTGDKVVVYPGGMRSPVLTQDYQEAYLSWVESVVSNSVALAGLEKRNIVAVIPPQMLNSRAVSRLREYGTVVEAGVNALGNLLKEARCLVVAPGIETMLEATALGLKPHYLPAYNGSHIPQLIAYRKAGVGDEICPSYSRELEELEKDTDWLNKLTMDVSQKNLESLSDPKYVDEATINLRDILAHNEAKAPRYPLGRNGSSQLVDLVRQYL